MHRQHRPMGNMAMKSTTMGNITNTTTTNKKRSITGTSVGITTPRNTCTDLFELFALSTGQSSDPSTL